MGGEDGGCAGVLCGGRLLGHAGGQVSGAQLETGKWKEQLKYTRNNAAWAAQGGNDRKMAGVKSTQRAEPWCTRPNGRDAPNYRRGLEGVLKTGSAVPASNRN